MALPTLLIASDHAGFELKREIQKQMTHVTWLDLGPANSDRVDYPDFAEKLGKSLNGGNASLGILICGSGIGMSIAANKIPGIRAATVENPSAARLAREHNDANVLCLGARFIAPEYAVEMIQGWMNAQFAGGRHAGRVDKMKKLEEKFT